MHDILLNVAQRSQTASVEIILSNMLLYGMFVLITDEVQKANRLVRWLLATLS